LLLSKKSKKEIATMSKVQMNAEAPDFTLIDFNDEKFTLSSYRGQKNVLLVLNRGFI
jgi:peroxiredoxin